MRTDDVDDDDDDDRRSDVDTECIQCASYSTTTDRHVTNDIRMPVAKPALGPAGALKMRTRKYRTIAVILAMLCTKRSNVSAGVRFSGIAIVRYAHSRFSNFVLILWFFAVMGSNSVRFARVSCPQNSVYSNNYLARNSAWSFLMLYYMTLCVYREA